MIVPVSLIAEKLYHFNIDEPLQLKIEKVSLFENNAVSVLQDGQKVGYISGKSFTHERVLNHFEKNQSNCNVWAIYKNKILIIIND